MEKVQSFDRPLAYQLAKEVAYSKENRIDSSSTLTFSGAPESGGDVIYDF